MKKILIIIICLFSISAFAMEKKTTFNKELFNKAQSDGKIVIVSSWIKYCTSCEGQMKILNQAKSEGKLSDINFDNIEYFTFDVSERCNVFDVLGFTVCFVYSVSRDQGPRLFIDRPAECLQCGVSGWSSGL